MSPDRAEEDRGERDRDGEAEAAEGGPRGSNMEEGLHRRPPQNFEEAFEAAEAGDEGAGGDIDEARHQPDLDDAEALVVDLAGRKVSSGTAMTAAIRCP